MVEEKQYKISEMTKLIKVEAHVLRYWEEELQLPIKRNNLGHRYYTQEDVERFLKVRDLKEKGIQLKGIRILQLAFQPLFYRLRLHSPVERCFTLLVMK